MITGSDDKTARLWALPEQGMGAAEALNAKTREWVLWTPQGY